MLRLQKRTGWCAEIELLPAEGAAETYLEVILICLVAVPQAGWHRQALNRNPAGALGKPVAVEVAGADREDRDAVLSDRRLKIWLGFLGRPLVEKLEFEYDVEIGYPSTTADGREGQVPVRYGNDGRGTPPAEGQGQRPQPSLEDRFKRDWSDLWAPCLRPSRCVGEGYSIAHSSIGAAWPGCRCREVRRDRRAQPVLAAVSVESGAAAKNSGSSYEDCGPCSGRVRR